MNPSELVRKADGALLRSVPVTTLARANITSLSQVENKKWRLSQVTSPEPNAVTSTAALVYSQFTLRVIYLVFPGVLPGKTVEWTKADGF